MALVKINKETLTEIADAIRIRNKSTDKYFLKDMPQAVRDIYNNPKSTYQGTEADIIALGDYTGETYENLEITALGENAFGTSSTLKNLILPNVQTVGKGACMGLPITKIDEYDFSYAMEIGDSAFYNCKELTEVYLPMAKTIGKYAFENCTKLTKIKLPMIKSIGQYAFDGCTNLTDIYVGVASKDDITYEPWGATNATIHYGFTG